MINDPKHFCNTHLACKAGEEFALQYKTMEEVWDNCTRVDWLFWVLKRINHPYNKQKLAAKFVREIFHLLKDQRSKDAIIAIENDCFTDEIKHAAYAAYAAAADAADAAYAAYAAAADAADAAYAAAAADAAADAAAAAAAADAAYADARSKQVTMIKEYIGNPFRAES